LTVLQEGKKKDVRAEANASGAIAAHGYAKGQAAYSNHRCGGSELAVQNIVKEKGTVMKHNRTWRGSKLHSWTPTLWKEDRVLALEARDRGGVGGTRDKPTSSIFKGAEVEVKERPDTGFLTQEAKEQVGSTLYWGGAPV